MYRQSLFRLVSRGVCLTRHLAKHQPGLRQIHLTSSRLLLATPRRNPLSTLPRRVATTITCRFLSSHPGDDHGEQVYQEYLQLRAQLEDLRNEKEKEKSQAMYEAWQRTQDRQDDDKRASKKNPGVAVVKTLVKQTRKELKKAQAPEKQLQEAAQQKLHEAALQYGHAAALVQLGNQTLAAATNDLSNADKYIDKTLDLYQLGGKAGSKEGWFNHAHLLWTGFPDQTEQALHLVDDTDADADDDNNSNVPIILSPDPVRAIESFEKAIELGDADAMYFVGSYLLSIIDSDEAVPSNDDRLPDLTKGLALIEQAASAGHGGALYYLALFHLGGHVALDISPCTAQEFGRRLDAAVATENEEALFLRGHSYYHGENGYPRDARKALQDFLRAADAGHADAAVSAGAMLHAGDGVPRDQRKSFELYQHAGELGSMEGWRNVAACYATGEGVTRSLEMAKHITKTMKLAEAPPAENAS